MVKEVVDQLWEDGFELLEGSFLCHCVGLLTVADGRGGNGELQWIRIVLDKMSASDGRSWSFVIFICWRGLWWGLELFARNRVQGTAQG